MERGVQRVARPADGPLHVVQQRRRAERELDHVVEQLEAGRVAQPHAELAEAAHGQAVAGREPDVLVREAAMDVPDPGAVVRVALEVAAIGLEHAPVGRGVDVVDRPPHRREAAGDERRARGPRGDRAGTSAT